MLGSFPLSSQTVNPKGSKRVKKRMLNIIACFTEEEEMGACRQEFPCKGSCLGSGTMEHLHTNLLHSIPFSENNGVIYCFFVIERSL